MRTVPVERMVEVSLGFQAPRELGSLAVTGGSLAKQIEMMRCRYS